MKYLITGGAGFIGSHLADALVARGAGVVILDDLSTGSLANIDHHQHDRHVLFVEGTILDEAVIADLVPQVDVVVHLAASVGVHRIIQRPLESLMNNIRGTEIVLEACSAHDRKVLVASSSEIYGKNSSGPLSEDVDRILGSPLKTRWSYSTSKAVDEILAHTYWRERGTPTIIVRLFNCVGSRQTGAYGMVVPRLVQQALLGEDLTVYGSGEQRRSFCHVQDTVGAIISLLDEPRSIGDVFNIGAPEETTINDLARLILSLTSSSSRIVHVPYEVAYEEGFEDMERRLPSVSRIQALTGWRPSRRLTDTVADVVDHTRARLATMKRP